MWLILRGFFASNVLKIAQVGFAALSIVLILLGARNSGKSAERAKNYEGAIKDIEEAKKARSRIKSGDIKRVSKFYVE